MSILQLILKKIIDLIQKKDKFLNQIICLKNNIKENPFMIIIISLFSKRIVVPYHKKSINLSNFKEKI